MRILLTGGAGYLGSNIANELSLHNHDFLIYDNFSTGHKHIIENFSYIEADIRDAKKLDECFKTYKPDIVIHLASLATVGDCENNPQLCEDINIHGTKLILDKMLEYNVSKIIFASSAAVYDTAKSALTESSSLQPPSIYGKSKLRGEDILKEYVKKGISSVAFRIFNLAGADENCEFGELHHPETHIIPLALQAAHDNTSLNVFGGNYRTSDGTAIRDYIHVTDVARAFLAACDFVKNNLTAKAINLGSGSGISVLELIKKISELTSKNIDVKIIEKRKGDETALVADITEAKKCLNWQPSQSGIENVITTANAWHLKNYQ